MVAQTFTQFLPPKDWVGSQIPDPSERSAENIRYMAMGIEDTLKKDGRGVSLAKNEARLVIRALWDLADRVELNYAP